MKPLVGITAALVTEHASHGDILRYLTSAAYTHAVADAGGVPVILPPLAGNADVLLDALDALILSGGGDIEPWRFGDVEIHPATYGLSPERDQFELDLFDGALARDLPVLGICRGIQVMNVGLGGTLIQDIADQHSPEIPHRQHEHGLATDDVGHPVAVVPGTPLADLFPTLTVGTNSYHHQAVRDLAPGLVAAAHAPDGTIEALTSPAHPFLLGVQWHPELMFERHPEQLRLFAALVEAATTRKLTATAA